MVDWLQPVIMGATAIMGAAIGAATTIYVQRRANLTTADANVQDAINEGFRVLMEARAEHDRRTEAHLTALRRTVLHLVAHIDKLTTAMEAGGLDVPTMEAHEDWPFDLIMGVKKS